METARAFWSLDDLLDQIVSQVVETGETPAEVIDSMGPIRLRPEDQWFVTREGLRSLANGRNGGMRSFRSGKVQTKTMRQRPLQEEAEGLVEYFDGILSRLVFEAADGRMKPVLDFGNDDAKAAYERRVVAAREQANREEPFWRAVMDATESGRTVGRRSQKVRREIARLAIAQKLTTNGDDEG